MSKFLLETIIYFVFWTIGLGNKPHFHSSTGSFFRKSSSQDKRALVIVTGCSSGIGKCLALELATKGYLVVATVRKDDDAQNLKAEYKNALSNSSHKENLIIVLADVTIKEDLEKLYRKVDDVTKDAQIELRGVISNAGLASFSIFEIVDLENTAMHFDINYFGAVQVALKFTKFLKESKGRIIFIGSIASSSTLRYLHAYCATKIALKSTAQVLNAELNEYGIKVSVIEPGFIDTAIFEKTDIIYKELRQKESKSISDFCSAGFMSNGKAIKKNSDIEISPHDLKHHKKAINFSKNQFYYFTKFAISPKHVVYHCEYILNAPFVSSCYRVGLDSYVIKLLELLPDYLVEKFRLLT